LHRILLLTREGKIKMDIEQSIFIVLTDDVSQFQGKNVATIDKEKIAHLNQLVNTSESLNRLAQKLTGKREQMYRHSQKLMRQVIQSHRIPVNFETEAVGISKATDEIYVGPKDEVANDPAGEPKEGYLIKGKVTKYERRKYDELLINFDKLNMTITTHNVKVVTNENAMIEFEKEVLANEEYDRKANILVVSSVTGEVLLCDNPDNV
jgi:hypothetical protein